MAVLAGTKKIPVEYPVTRNVHLQFGRFNILILNNVKRFVLTYRSYHKDSSCEISNTLTLTVESN